MMNLRSPRWYVARVTLVFRRGSPRAWAPHPAPHCRDLHICFWLWPLQPFKDKDCVSFIIVSTTWDMVGIE